MNKPTWLLLFIIPLLFTNCGSETPETDPIFDRKIPIKKRIQLALEKELTTEIGFDQSFATQLTEFYKARDYRPLWTNDSMVSEKGELLQSLLKNQNAVGLPSTRLQTNERNKIEQHIVVKELEMTAQFSQLLNDLKVGIMDTSKNHMRPKLPCATPDLTLRLRQFDTVQQWGSWFASMGPELPDYRNLAKALFDRVYNKTVSNKSFKIPTFKEDSLKAHDQSKLALIEKGYLASSGSEEDYKTSLEKFQEDHALKPDALLGKYTCELLGESEQHQIERTVLSLERWRWRSKFPEKYIWINIPEYVLRLYINDTMYSEHRVVVGKPENTTPQLTSTIRSIVALPFWTQPQSIASKEFLPAQKANSNYAARNHYKVYRGGQEVDPKSINWKKYKENNMPFRITQDPGEDNALGLVKFEFNNKYGVYVHDTPSKSFFNKDVRAYSHGCVRCQMPDSLARYILYRDKRQKFLPDSLDSVISRKEHMVIPLHEPITVQIDYITVTATPEGKLCYRADVYKRDEEYLKWMK